LVLAAAALPATGPWQWVCLPSWPESTMSDVTSAAIKPRVLLSILKCACFEHLEGENLFTAISAGFGRFECERLLKPSGVELMNLPQSSNIEVSVLRRLPNERERPKQLLYHGIVSLAAVQPTFTAGGGDAQAWESWLGLFSSDVSIKAQDSDRLFSRCLEMGTSGARFPRLLLRLQYLSPSTTPPALPRHLPPTAVGPTTATSPLDGLDKPGPGNTEVALRGIDSYKASGSYDKGSTAADSTGAPSRIGTASAPRSPNTASLGTSIGSSLTTSAIGAHTRGASAPGWDPKPPGMGMGLGMEWRQEADFARAAAEARKEHQEVLKAQVTELQEKDAAREAALRMFFEQVSPRLHDLGQPLQLSAQEAAASMEGMKAQLDSIAAALDQAPAASNSAQTPLQVSKDPEPALGDLCKFYKPVKSDIVDCMLAASLLRLDSPPEFEVVRLEPGIYRFFGTDGIRHRCYTSNGRVMVRPVEQQMDHITASNGDSVNAVELSDFLRRLPEREVAPVDERAVH